MFKFGGNVRIVSGSTEAQPEELLKLEGKNVKRAVLLAKKVMVRGEEKFEITGWRNVKELDDLPIKYATGIPRFYEREIGGLRLIIGSSSIDISRGRTFTKKDFGTILDVMKEAGAILAEINRDIKKREAEWVGPEKEYQI